MFNLKGDPHILDLIFTLKEMILIIILGVYSILLCVMQEECITCGYYCNKEYGHQGLHSTNHGNMSKAHIVIEETEDGLDFGPNKRLHEGDDAVTLLCHMHCISLGQFIIYQCVCFLSQFKLK